MLNPYISKLNLRMPIRFCLVTGYITVLKYRFIMSKLLVLAKIFTFNF